MKNIIKIPISTMIRLLKEIGKWGHAYKLKTINYNINKIISLFSHQIRTFNTHFILTKNLLAQNTNLSFNYEIMFQKYMELIFFKFYKIKIQNTKIYVVQKNFPNLRLFFETKKIIDDFIEEEENIFKTDEIKKNCFILYSFLDCEDENKSNYYIKKE